ncbi:MAG: nitroreductase [Leptospira sp.]|nr:nitroreductase [Leptospira sp.]
MESILIDNVANTVVEAVRTRHSVREYEDRKIPSELLQELFAESLRAPSWKNSQPWRIHIVTGEARDRMSEKLVSAARAGAPNPDSPWLENYPSDVKRRMFDLGMRVYGVAGIDRKDKAAREAFMLRNFEFFGAPAAAFITTNFEMNFYVGLDIGCLLQTVMLLARTYGLGTCPQAALGAFPDVVRSEFGLPVEERVVCGISLGYPKPGSGLNEFHSPREEFSSLVKFYDQ